MAESSDKEALAKIREEVGQRLRQIRTAGLELSQEQLGRDTPHLTANNIQVRIATLERGNGSAATIYAVLKHLYSRGANINYLFGEEESLLRVGKQVSLYPENISDYLEDMVVTAGSAHTLIEEILTNTKRVQNYVARTVEMAEEDGPSTKK